MSVAFYQTVIQSSNCVIPTVMPWPDILNDLRANGVSGTKVAEMIGISWSTLQHQTKGFCEPRESYGRALLAIHKHFCGEDQHRLRIQQATLITI